MRILFVNEKCGYFGGVEQNIAETVAGLAKAGHQCFLAWAEEARDCSKYAALFENTAPSSDFGEGGTGNTIKNLAETFEVDSVYIHKIRKLPELEPIRPRRIVRMVHDHDLCCPRRHKYFFHNQRICRKPFGVHCVLDLAFLEKNPGSPLKVKYAPLGPKYREMKRNRELDALMVGSRFMREELLMNGFPAERVHILPPVVRRVPSDSGPVPDEPNILYVGQLIRGKGVDLLLEALAQLERPFKAQIVGDGNARPALEAQCRELALDGRVRFEGWVPRSGIDAYYAQAKVLAVPSRWPEPFGMIGLEAMNHGRPVVGFDAGGIGDWLKDGKTGFLVPENDPAAFAKSLERILSDTPLAQKMGEEARKTVSDEYDFDGYLTCLAGHLSGVESVSP